MAERGRGAKRDVAADADLPLYPGIALADIVLVDSAAVVAVAVAELLAADAVGFDTESKPTFAKGEVSTGPHLVQLATDRKAYLFPVDRLPGLDGLKAVLVSTSVCKVGFGLDSDVARLKSKFGIEMHNVVDLAVTLRVAGEKNTVGARVAVTRHFGQRLQKSRRVSTSNWALPQLSESQMRYAADDAQVSLRLYRATRPQAPTPVPPRSVWRRLLLWLRMGRSGRR